MKFTLVLGMVPADRVLALARAAETTGWDAVSFPDSVFYPEEVDVPYPYSRDGDRNWPEDTPFVDPLVGLAAVGAATERLGLYTNVLKTPIREPLLVAKSLGSIAALFPGRVALGVGLSWIPQEFSWLGQDMRTRGARLDEQIGIIRAVLAGGYVEHHGRHYDFDRLRMDPHAPAGERVPIYVGGHSDAAIRRAATLGDGWIAATATEDQMAELIRRLRDELARVGRADEPFEVKGFPLVEPTAEAMVRIATLGVTDVTMMPWVFSGGDPQNPRQQLDAVKWFADAVIAPTHDLEAASR